MDNVHVWVVRYIGDNTDFLEAQINKAEGVVIDKMEVERDAE